MRFTLEPFGEIDIIRSSEGINAFRPQLEWSSTRAAAKFTGSRKLHKSRV
jgi:hypothetical protein